MPGIIHLNLQKASSGGKKYPRADVGGEGAGGGLGAGV